jgi:PAS domain S-box-containing protein
MPETRAQKDLIAENKRLQKRIKEQEQRDAERKLQKSEAFNRGLLQAAPLGIGLVADRVFQFVNPAMCAMVGYSEKELVGSKSVLIYQNKSEFQRAGNVAYSQLEGSQVGTVETQFRRKNGTIIDVLGSVCHLDPQAPDKGQIFVIKDITQRKLYETNLKSAKETYEDLMKMAPDGIITVDLLGRVTSVNQAFVKLTEYSQEELVGKHFTQLSTILSKDIPRYISLFTEILKGNHNQPFDFRWKTKGRVIRYGEIRTALIRKNNRVSGIQAIIRDNTEKKEHAAAQNIVYQIADEAKSVESFDQLFKFIHKAVAEIMPAKNNFYIALYDEENQLLDFPYFQDELESNPGPQPVGKGLTEHVLFSGEALLATPEKLKKLEKEGKIKLVGPPCVDWLGVPLRHENFPMGVMVVQSYTEGIRFTETHKNLFKFISDQIGSVIERKRGEEALRKNEREYRALFEYGNNAVTLFDMDGYLIAANRKAAALLGYEVEEMKGLSYKKIVHPREEWNARSKLHLARKSKPIPLYDRRCLRKDGSEFIGEFAVSPVHDDSGNLLFIQSIFRDVTEQRRNEHEIRNSRERLRNFAAHLQSAREQERTHIAREIHDELGQYLTALKLDINWMSRHANDGNVNISQKIRDMDEITSHTIQTVRKISTELRPGLIDDLGFTAALEWQAEEFERRTGVKTSFRLPPDEIPLDKERAIAVFRIFQEALTNIARHSKASKVTISMKRNNGNLHLKIKDNGIGIHKKQMDSPDSFGLIGIQERAQFLGGRTRIVGHKESGTTVDVLVPITAQGGPS